MTIRYSKVETSSHSIGNLNNDDMWVLTTAIKEFNERYSTTDTSLSQTLIDKLKQAGVDMPC